MPSVLVTGSTGLIGRHLTERLLERGGPVTLLIRPGSIERNESLLQTWSARATASGGELRVVPGDVTQPGLTEDELAPDEFEHVFHLAGYYDLEGDPAQMQAVNVEGTRHLLQWLRSGDFGGTLHHVSSVAVAGDFAGVFPEDELELGQGHPHPYLQSKFDAEALVRSSENLRWRIYRPSAVVGDSETGAMDRVDGPYHLFKAVKKLRHALPGWFPLLGWTREKVNMVPVDWVADVLDHIADLEGLDARTFHVVDPDPLSLPEFFNATAEVAGAPRIVKTFSKGPGFLSGARQVVSSLGATAFVRKQLLEEFGIPAALADAKNPDVTYATDNLEDALKDTDLRCPSPDSYLPAMWHYWAQHLDPERDEALRWRRAFDGKRVLITGASSGVGEALAYRCAEAGATVICVARREERLQEVTAAIAEAGGTADYYVADLSDHERCDALIAEVLEDHGGVDVLVNNAAKSIRRSIEEEYERFHDYQRVLDINYLAPVKLCLGFLPGMVQRGGGHIVSVLTAGANIPSPRFSAYTASKAALGAFTDTLSAEYLHAGVHTTTAYLGWVATPMMTATEKYREKVQRGDVMTPDDAARWMMDGVALKKRRLQTGETTRRFVWTILFPTFMTRALSLVHQIYHDDPERFPQYEFDRAMFRKVFKTDPL